MVHHRWIFGLALLVSWTPMRDGGAQSPAKPLAGDRPYTLTVPVDEVSLTFHASDFQGMPMEDLALSDLRLKDNGTLQRRLLSFESYRNLPIRAGILFDVSRSMLWRVKRNREIASLYVTHLLRKQTDKAFVMRFDFETQMRQDWTNDSVALAASLQAIASGYTSRLGGTALFNAVYSACHDQWTSDPAAVTGNFILLFTDGIDNFSHARMRDVIDACQHTRTAIYVFSDERKSRFSDGQKTLRELVAKSGGRIFFDPAGSEIWHDLQIMEHDQRSQYRIVYKPSNLKLDGSFHRIKLDSPDRGGVITTRSGYYVAR